MELAFALRVWWLFWNDLRPAPRSNGQDVWGKGSHSDLQRLARHFVSERVKALPKQDKEAIKIVSCVQVLKCAVQKISDKSMCPHFHPSMPMSLAGHAQHSPLTVAALYWAPWLHLISKDLKRSTNIPRKLRKIHLKKKKKHLDFSSNKISQSSATPSFLVHFTIRKSPPNINKPIIFSNKRKNPKSGKSMYCKTQWTQ